MLASITPLGERGRGGRWAVTAAAYGAGSVAGGALAGAAFGGLGALARAAGSSRTAGAAWPIAALALFAAAFDATGVPVPGVHRQVNEDWLVQYRSWVYGGGFGFQLGVGVVTIVPTAGIYATWAIAAVTGSVGVGALIGAVFGLTRALPVLGAAGLRTPARLRRFHVRMHALAPVARWGTVALLGAVGVAAAAAA
jgi:hypothetical protein